MTHYIKNSDGKVLGTYIDYWDARRTYIATSLERIQSEGLYIESEKGKIYPQEHILKQNKKMGRKRKHPENSIQISMTIHRNQYDYMRMLARKKNCYLNDIVIEQLDKARRYDIDQENEREKERSKNKE